MSQHLGILGYKISTKVLSANTNAIAGGDTPALVLPYRPANKNCRVKLAYRNIKLKQLLCKWDTNTVMTTIKLFLNFCAGQQIKHRMSIHQSRN